MRNYEKVAAQIAAGTTVDYADVVEMFELVKQSGRKASQSGLHDELFLTKQELRELTNRVEVLNKLNLDLGTARDVARAENDGLRRDKTALMLDVQSMAAANVLLKRDNATAQASLTQAAERIEALNARIEQIEAEAISGGADADADPANDEVPPPQPYGLAQLQSEGVTGEPIPEGGA